LASWLSAKFFGSFLMVALGLGLVIFFHELGHFAVAKWCGVLVERFSIGFGPILWSRKWGETEYALSAVPFGGYVKMLGQDDLDPGQETSSEISGNPRSYTAKTVPQKMAIISAGVIMNLITGLMFFVGAMWIGLEVTGNEIGFVQPGMPAWEAGVRADDQVVSINGAPAEDFADITRGTALSHGVLTFRGRRPDGEEYEQQIKPDASGTKRLIGVGPQSSPVVAEVTPEDGIPLALPGRPAATAANGFHAGDRVTAIGGEPIASFHDLRRVLTDRRGDELVFSVSRPADLQRKDERQPAEVTVAAERYRWLGLRMEIGPIVGVQRDSPAAQAGIQRKDRIIKVQPLAAATGEAGEAPAAAAVLEVGRDLDPARLPDWFADHAGQPVQVTIEREGQGRELKTVELTPLPRRNWQDDPFAPTAPLDVPAIGVAFHFVPRVLSVEPGSPADKEGIKPNDVVTIAEFLKPADWPIAEDAGPKPVDIGEKGWAYVQSFLQRMPTWKVRLTLRPGGQEPVRAAVLTPIEHPDWFACSGRGVNWMPDTRLRRAEGLAHAWAMGWDQSRDTATDIYLTLRGLFSGSISAKELHGPVGIFSLGVKVAAAGIAPLLAFLGFLSVNLAVLNFLPIPVLDGGHMVFLMWEGITRRRPNENFYATAMYVGLMFVLGLMIWVLYLDAARWFAD